MVINYLGIFVVSAVLVFGVWFWVRDVKLRRSLGACEPGVSFRTLVTVG